MRLFLSFFVCILFTGCGSIFSTVKPPEQNETDYSVPIQILEKNKEELNKIKNNTAADIQLGHTTRVLEKKEPNDKKFGEAVRTVVQKQEQQKQYLTEKPSSEKKIDFVFPCIILFLFNLICVIGLFMYVRKCFHELLKK